ncbi:hypothetical protein GCM10010885_20400 [Alicyclobacillus cellulosilyticus]|uniref:DUF1146 domain-containing protein n=1 Tax=Alicyclobacillus cellulosilyticus TaxID=1003997 RepID=A0A917NLW6_9BACL|nr:DUF1146 family protein [Alicyclobacillus cellulosilyticus]GGJ11054.1 hypothetical protein GCM10010885_20400 [Alicyclobacillus cellulosilyticus]
MNPLYSVAAAVDGAVFIAALLAGTYAAWWALGILRWDRILADPFGPQARLLRFLLALAGGLVCGLVAILYVAAAQAFRLALP